MDKYLVEKIVVPTKIENKLREINLFIYEQPEDINEYLANFFFDDEFTIRVFHKKLEEKDLEKIYYALIKQLKNDSFKNNGILFEHFCNMIIGKHYNLRNLININYDFDFETPKSGTDIIFLDRNYKLQFYEVKSRSTEKQSGLTSDLVKLIKNGITSTFCTKTKNTQKLVDTKWEIEDDKERENVYNLIKQLLKAENYIDYVDNEHLEFNICVIGERLNIDKIKFKEEIVKVFDTTKYCVKSCECNVSGYCTNKILDRIKIVNVVNIQFMGVFSIKKVYENIVEKIEKMEVV